MGAPLVSVLMPVKNGGAYVAEAVQSIIDQTFNDWELVVVENGSTDDTVSIVSALAVTDGRIRMLQIGNVGLVEALNRGLSEVRGEYVARMDADDISDPTRLGQQARFLDEHPDCLLVGTGYRYIDDDGNVIARRRVVATNEALRAEVFFGNPIGHSTVMFAPSRVNDPLQYSDQFPDAEDFELWLRLSAEGKLANIATPLLSHRVHSAAATQAAGNRNRVSSVRALTRHSAWPESERIYRATYNPRDELSYWAQVRGLWALNVKNLGDPQVQRRQLLLRSMVAAGRPIRSWIRGALRRGRVFGKSPS